MRQRYDDDPPPRSAVHPIPVCQRPWVSRELERLAERDMLELLAEEAERRPGK